jgi:hypothetical protein
MIEAMWMRSAAHVLALAFLACSHQAAKGSESPPPRTASPTAVPSPPPGPVAYRLAFDVGLEHGCSQSNESRGADGTLEIEIDAKNRATLTVHSEHTSVIGPSFSMYKQGHDDFFTTFKKEHAVYAGSAERTPNRVDLAFETVSRSAVEWMEYGDPDLPEPTPSSAHLTLACRIAPLEIYGPVPKDGAFWNVDGETPMLRDVLLCRPSGPLFEGYEDMILVEESFPMLEGDGLALESDILYYNERLVIRLAGSS